MQPFSNSYELLTISCSHKNFLMISQTVQELSRWQTSIHTHKWTLPKTTDLARLCCSGGKHQPCKLHQIFLVGPHHTIEQYKLFQVWIMFERNMSNDGLKYQINCQTGNQTIFTNLYRYSLILISRADISKCLQYIKRFKNMEDSAMLQKDLDSLTQ